jgi:hypothetical protein
MLNVAVELESQLLLLMMIRVVLVVMGMKV